MLGSARGWRCNSVGLLTHSGRGKRWEGDVLRAPLERPYGKDAGPSDPIAMFASVNMKMPAALRFDLG